MTHMCSYCGCKDIELIGRYMEEHEELINDLGILRRACEKEDLAEVKAACDHLAAMMRPHFDSEERSLFAVLREDADFSDHVDMLCTEHEDLWDLFDDVWGGKFDGYKALEDRLRVHMDREDNGLFPAAAVSLDGPSWERIMQLDGQGMKVPGHAHEHGHDHGHDHPDGHDHTRSHAQS